MRCTFSSFGLAIQTSFLIILIGLTSARADVTLTVFTDPHPLLTGGTIGFTYAGNKFVGSVQADGFSVLYSTDLDGGNVVAFAQTVFIPGGSPASEHFVASSLGLGGFPLRDVYVAAGANIIHIDNAGTSGSTFLTGDLASPVRGILFDPVGTFAHDMLVTTSGGQVYRVDSAGSATLLATTGEDTEGLDVAPLGAGFGGHDGDLIVASEGSGTIRAISTAGEVTDLFTVPAAEELTFVPLNLGASGKPVEGFYGANYPPNVVKAAASQFAGFQGDVIVTSEFGDHRMTRIHWDGSAFVQYIVAYFPNQPEDGIFVTDDIINPQCGTDGTPCDDGNPCTQTSMCQNDVCVGSNPLTCSAIDACHAVGTCDPATGACSNPPAPDGTPCDDGNTCTTGDACSNGVCVGTGGGTHNITGDVHCDNTFAIYTAAAENPGMTLTYTGITGCYTAARSVTINTTDRYLYIATWSDEFISQGLLHDLSVDGRQVFSGDPRWSVTYTDTDIDVLCPAAPPSNVAPKMVTTIPAPPGGWVAPAVGCANPPPGQTCYNDWGNQSTIDLSARRIWYNSGNQVSTNAPFSPGFNHREFLIFRLDMCNGCGPDGTACNDGDACTLTDTCQGGVCVGSNPVVCTALDQCHDSGACDPASGACSQPTLPDGTGCEDGSACTAGDTCNGGVCTGGPPAQEVCNGVDDDCNGFVDEGCSTGKVTGGGEIAVPGGVANFGFIAQIKTAGESPTGSLEYHNHASGLRVHSVAIQTLSITGNKATFTGTCLKNGATPCTFSVTVEDNGEPGRNVDKFTIAVSGEPIEGGTAPIIRGNIQIHTPAAGQTSPLSDFAAAGGGGYPVGTSFLGIPIHGLRLGTGVDVPGNGSAEGVAEVTLLGTGPGGQPRLVTIETNVTQGYVIGPSSVTLSGAATVDLGDGSPPLTGQPFTLTMAPNASQQETIMIAVDQASLPATTVIVGGVTLPPCNTPPEVEATLAFTTADTMTWQGSPAASAYNVYRGTIERGTWSYNQACFASVAATPEASDSSTPIEGQAFYYLVSIRNDCGEGPLGSDSSGQQLPNYSPCF